MTRIKIITSSKGGAGKTALACSLMLAALKNGKRVLLVDLNVNNLDLSRIMCSSEFLLPQEGSFITTEINDDIILLSKDVDASLYMAFRKNTYQPLKARNLWQFLERLLARLKTKEAPSWFQTLEIIVDTSFNVTSLFPFSMSSQIVDRTKYQLSRKTILELQANVTETIKRMISNFHVTVEIFTIVDSLRAKSYLFPEKHSESNDEVVPLDEFNELRYYYRLEKKIVDELGQEIIYVFSPRPIIPERGIFAVVQDAVKKILGKKEKHVYYPLIDGDDFELLQQTYQKSPIQSLVFRTRNLEGYLESLNVDDVIKKFVSKPRWELFLEIEREIFQHIVTTVLHKDGRNFPRNVLIIPAFVHSMVYWSELIQSHGKIIDEKDFELTLGFFLEQVKRWYEWRVKTWEELQLLP